MRILKPLSIALLLATSQFANADIKLNVPSNVALLAVDMEKPTSSGGFFSSTESVTLADGEHQIVFRYEPQFENNNERVEVSSDVYIAKFNASNTELNFVLPEYRDEDDANQSINDLQWSLIDSDKQTITVSSDKLKKSGVQLGRDYLRESEMYNRKGGVAAIGIVTTVVTLPAGQQKMAPVINAQDFKASPDSTAEEMLHFWYNKADAKTKAKFRDYINK